MVSSSSKGTADSPEASLTAQQVLKYLSTKGYGIAALALQTAISKTTSYSGDNNNVDNAPPDHAALLRARRSTFSLLGGQGATTGDSSSNHSAYLWAVQGLMSDSQKLIEGYNTLHVYVLSLSDSFVSMSGGNNKKNTRDGTDLGVLGGSNPKLELQSLLFVMLCHVYLEVLSNEVEAVATNKSDDDDDGDDDGETTPLPSSTTSIPSQANDFLNSHLSHFQPLFPSQTSHLLKLTASTLYHLTAIIQKIQSLSTPLLHLKTKLLQATKSIEMYEAAMPNFNLSTLDNGASYQQRITTNPDTNRPFVAMEEWWNSSQCRKLAEARQQLKELDGNLRGYNGEILQLNGQLNSNPFISSLLLSKAIVVLSPLAFQILNDKLTAQDSPVLTGLMFKSLKLVVPTNSSAQQGVSTSIGIVQRTSTFVPSILFEPSAINQTPCSSDQLPIVKYGAPLPLSIRASIEGIPSDKPELLNLPFDQQPLQAHNLGAPASKKMKLDKDQETSIFPDFDRAEPGSYNYNLLHSHFRTLASLETALERDSFASSQEAAKARLIQKPKEGRNAHEDKGSVFCPSIAINSIDSGNGVIVQASGSDSRASGSGSVKLMPSSCSPIVSISLSPPDGRSIAASSEDGSIRIFSHTIKHSSKSATAPQSDVVQPKAGCKILVGHTGELPVYNTGWFKDARTLLSAGGDATVKLWDTAASSSSSSHNSSSSSADLDKWESQYISPLNTYTGHTPHTQVYDVSPSPSGYYFASCGSDQTVRLWSTDHASPLRLFSGHFGAVGCVKFHPNCNYIASGSHDTTVRLWDVQSGRCMRVMTGMSGRVTKLAFCPSGKYLTALDAMGKLGIYDIGSGRKINELNRDTKTVGFKAYSLTYSHCGSCIAVGSTGGISLFDVRRSECDGRAGMEEVRSVKSESEVMCCEFLRGGVILAGGRSF